MMLGVLFTLTLVALLTVFVRDRLVEFTTRHGASLQKLTRVLDAVSGLLLIVLSVGTHWS